MKIISKLIFKKDTVLLKGWWAYLFHINYAVWFVSGILKIIVFIVKLCQ